MLLRWFNWRTLLTLAAIVIIGSSIIYSNYLAKKITADERRKIEQWAAAVRTNSNPYFTETHLTGKILTENSIEIPILLLTEKDSLLDFRNVDSLKVLTDKHYLQEKINSFKKINQPIEWINPYDSSQINKVYYGESKLLQEVRYFPMVQLIVAGLFVLIVAITQYTRFKSTQNQVWVGLAKETAHQLGTPVSSLQGWVEMLKETEGNEKIVPEIEKDVQRLLLISDRFGKIGSKPTTEEKNIIEQINYMIDYVKKRAGAKVNFHLNTYNETDIPVMISPPLFDWVIENLLKNALDAMDGSGTITINIQDEITKVVVDVSDTGKGIDKRNLNKVFKPGFSTKKRGWGLGLTLTKRIIEQYHKGQIFVLKSEHGIGTTFRILLPKG
ncbi:MAG: HAMP domain-containing histidine kinase [Chitinophagaceae bacterium]|nr:HAMP domain-containing histidine kinase [Chitinophagaceae bacterium]MCW5905816.1 HAMP domain-containing histidine kinase [Chitinophagaceae bacterium]